MSEALAPQLTVESVTGIDVALPVAGVGARSYAFIIDWLIRTTLALAWYWVGAVIYNRGFSLTAPLTNSARWFGAVVLPAMAIYFLYHPVMELAQRGRTPGKRSAGIRIVTRLGGPAGAGALLVRNVFRLIDSLPTLYGVGLTVMLFSRESLRIGDMAAGTLLVYERATTDDDLPEAAATRLGTLDPVGAEIVADLLQRWQELEPGARVRMAREVLRRYQGEQADVSDAEDLGWRSRLERLAQSGH